MTDFDQLKERALRLLVRREFSEHELRQRLLEKTTDRNLVDQVLHILVELDLLNNQRFVESYTRRRAAKGFGPLHIENELRKQQIDYELIQRYLDDEGLDWADNVKKLFVKKFRATCLADNLQVRMKQIRFLQNRGFELAQINEYLTKSKNEYQ